MKREVGTDMKISTFKYFFVDAFKSIKRNRTISIASMITVSATLLIFGIFMLLAMNINGLVDTVESKVEIKVYLTKNVTITQQRDIENKLRSSNGVKDVIYESKSQALENFKETLKENKKILNGYDSANNPLPSSFIVKLEKPEFADPVTNQVKNMAGVDDIANDRELIKKISTISSTVKWSGGVLFIILIGVSLFLIGNTIKLTVFSRRREIGIMKFVGATDWFIRWPFIIEGMVIGIIGALISDIFLYYIYRFAYGKITQALITAQLIPLNYVYGTMLWQFILAGVLIGALGSYISMRKFLEV